MICASCGRENPAENAYCGGCGAALSTRNPAAYTPRHLAERILGSRSALEGERKQVTVLFADVKGSTSLSEKAGAERWHGVLDELFAILTASVHRFEGTVNQYTGDGIMALFGAPVAHEDHAQRACHAALDGTRQLVDFCARLAREDLDLGVRMGLNSGEVIVGKIGDDLRMDYTAQGAVVARAARIEALAPPGRVWLGDSTAQLVEGRVQLEDMGEHALRGLPEPARLFELVGLEPEAGRLDTLRRATDLVGRGAELTRLEQALDEALEGSGKALVVVGEPGVGKTRLCAEFVERCRELDLPVHAVSCPSHARGLPRLVARELLRRCFGIEPDDSDEIMRHRVEESLHRLGISGNGMRLAALEMLGLDDGTAPEAERRARDARLFHRLVQAQSRAKPALWLIEDVQWLDPESERLVAEMLDALGWTRTLLVLTHRPGHVPAWVAPSYLAKLALGPLDDAAGRELLHAWLGTDPTLAPLITRLLEHTRGNPLFVEEIVRDLVRRKALVGRHGDYKLRGPDAELEIPSSIRALLSARIDTLEPRDKQVLLAAAVIADGFDPRVLERMTGLDKASLAASLASLERAELLHDAAFAHPLVRDTAYRSQLDERRTAQHAHAAEAIEALHADELGRHAELIAYHWEAAGKERIARRWRQRAALRVTNIQLRRRPGSSEPA